VFYKTLSGKLGGSDNNTDLKAKKSKKMPVLATRDMVIFPHVHIPIHIGRKVSKRSVFEALNKDSEIILILQKDPDVEDPKSMDDVYDVGTVCKVIKFEPIAGKDTYKLIISGQSRVRLKTLEKNGDFLEGEYEALENVAIDLENTHNKAMIDLFISELVYIIDRGFAFDALLNINDVNKPIVVSYLFLSKTKKSDFCQKILESTDSKWILEEAYKEVQTQRTIIDLKDKIAEKTKEQMSKSQKEYALKEQLKAIRRELGEDKESEVEEYERKLAKIKPYISEITHDEINKRIKKIEKSGGESAELSVTKSYLDIVFDLPWNEKTEDNLDMLNVQKILDDDHYDLEDVKDRIIEFLSVRKLNPKSKGPILCFAGPPGTGKTSVAKSIARALGRKIVSVSLGGVRDEAEIRGHRMTYVGAMPGKVINGMKQVKVLNPVFIFDEIDKLSHDFRGDPSSALLEVLDPEQNYMFKDHYLNLEYDLSKVMFIATANNVETIPPALKDRMEIIHLTGYCEEEKIEIAKRFLIKKQKTEKGLYDKEVSINVHALRAAIRNYTREFGVRDLDRQIDKICRKVARKKAEGKLDKTINVTDKNIEEFLGVSKYDTQTDNKNGIGLVTGLAWTPYGGEILKLEASMLENKGAPILTGRLGEVMKESATIALSLIKTNCKKWKIPKNVLDNIIHIHAPAGAVPKDGPSAGIALVGSLVSLLRQKKVKDSLAMTGEITLLGKVLPVGGVKEKILAAIRSDIKMVILPADNKKDFEDIAEHLRKKITVEYVSNVNDILKLIF